MTLLRAVLGDVWSMMGADVEHADSCFDSNALLFWSRNMWGQGLKAVWGAEVLLGATAGCPDPDLGSRELGNTGTAGVARCGCVMASEPCWP